MLLFYKLLIGASTAFAALTILFKNSFYACLYFIFVFISVGVLFITLDLEFLGLIFIMVYVGGIMVLFVFSVFTFNFKELLTSHSKTTSQPLLKRKYWFLAAYVFFLWQSQILYVYFFRFGAFFAKYASFAGCYFKSWAALPGFKSFSFYLYTKMYMYLLMVAFVLLLALIGVIVLSLEKNLQKTQVDFKSRNLAGVKLLLFL